MRCVLRYIRKGRLDVGASALASLQERSRFFFFPHDHDDGVRVRVAI